MNTAPRLYWGIASSAKRGVIQESIGAQYRLPGGFGVLPVRISIAEILGS
jgi:hypothetical protein